MSIVVRCSCGWAIRANVLGVPIAVSLATYAAEMVRHWQDGHRLSCRAEIRYQVRDLLKRYHQIQRARERGDDIVDMPRRRPRFGDEDWT